MDTEVLVVGAGPTGLMLANQLGRRGVRAMIIDRHAGPSLQTRALGVQARTLEIYSHLGIVERALELGKRATGANLWARGRPAARIPLGDIGRDLSPYPFLLILGQDDNERLLGEALRQWGVAVQWDTELVGLAQEVDRVQATLKQPDGTSREVTAAWVAGCDGAHSAVRELSGIAFQGAPYEHVFFVADTQMTGPMVPDEINVYLWRDGFHLFFPMRGTDHWRVVGILPPTLRGRDDLAFEDVFPSIRKEAGTGLSFQQCSWFSTYRIHHRRAERFRDRRCFLLGDAAHIHSPVGAQGMNTGLQDAYNLGWKLALVLSRRAGAAVLDSYEDERIPVAQRLLATTDRAFSLAVSDSTLSGLFRTRIVAKILALAMRFARMRKLVFRTISQIGIRYRESALSQTLPGLPDAAPRAGDRFPWLRLKLSAGGPSEDLFRKLDDTRFNLIVIGQPLVTCGGCRFAEPVPATSPGGLPGLGGLLRTHAIPSDPANDRELARANIPRPSFYLLRPDCYVGLSGIRLEAEAVTRYFSGRLDFGTRGA
jgi:2-polyprenyl-6-methoxyphenol hydroxylase-like FAD-dependent oxidoreductase